jgi:hypothetical protein
MCEQKPSVSQETYAETLARAMANPVHSKGCACERCSDAEGYRYFATESASWAVRSLPIRSDAFR